MEVIVAIRFATLVIASWRSAVSIWRGAGGCFGLSLAAGCMALENTIRSVGEAIRRAIAGAMAVRERWRSGVSYNPLSVRTV